MKKSAATVFLLFCLALLLVPKSFAADSLEAPAVTVPSGWSLDDQKAYPAGGGAVHDSQGCGWLQYLSSYYDIYYGSGSYYHLRDRIIIWYEDAMGASYSDAQLQSEAEAVASLHSAYFTPEFFSATTPESGVTNYVGVPAGYVKHHNTTVDLYALQLVLVKNGYYINIFMHYSQGNEAAANSVLNSISVPEPTPTPTPSLTPSPTPTPTPAPTATSTPTPTATPSQSPSPTATPTPASTETPTPTSTPAAYPTSTPTPTNTPSPTASPSSSPYPTPPTSAAPTSSPTPSPSLDASNVTASVWVPPPQNAAAATVVSVAAVGVVSLVFAAAGAGVAASGAAPTTGSMEKAAKKLRDLFPDTIKKWLEAFVRSKRKLAVTEKTGSPFVPTKPEGLAYILSTLFLAFSFSYVKVTDMSQILVVLPTIFATSILVGFAKTFFTVAYSRGRGIWAEHKVWYFGLATFIVTTFVFRVPFSSPTRAVYYGPKFTKRMGATLGCTSIFMSLIFAGFFGVLRLCGFAVIGGTGLAMCIIGAFFDTFPIAPMSGKNIFNYSKALWTGLFALTLALYASWLLFMQ